MRIPLLSLIFLLVFVSCKRKSDQDIQDCDSISGYYDKGIHYIDRSLVTDDNTIDYKKLFERTKQENGECYPAQGGN